MGDGEHSTEFGRLNRPSLWGILGQREMCAAAVVLGEIGPDRPAEARLAEHDDVVEALTPNGGDPIPWTVRLRYFLSSVLRSSFFFEKNQIGCGRC